MCRAIFVCAAALLLCACEKVIIGKIGFPGSDPINSSAIRERATDAVYWQQIFKSEEFARFVAATNNVPDTRLLRRVSLWAESESVACLSARNLNADEANRVPALAVRAINGFFFEQLRLKEKAWQDNPDRAKILATVEEYRRHNNLPAPTSETGSSPAWKRDGPARLLDSNPINGR